MENPPTEKREQASSRFFSIPPFCLFFIPPLVIFNFLASHLAVAAAEIAKLRLLENLTLFRAQDEDVYTLDSIASVGLPPPSLS